MKRASFFKVMIGDFAEKMLIPMQFLLDSGRELCMIDVAILNGPRGTVWRVGLKVEDGRMFFRRWWREFIKHHDIHEGYFLVFRYDGHSHFDVEVFYKSACLKKYASADDSCDCGTKERKNFPALGHSGHHSQPSNAMKRKNSTTENKPKKGLKEKVDYCEKNRGAECLSGWVSSKFKASETEDNQETKPGLKSVHLDNIKAKRLKAVKAGVEGKSSLANPKHPYFTAVIKRANLILPYMCIPTAFRMANDLPIGSTMTLRDPEQRLWTVEIARRRGFHGCYFRSGWTEFAAANSLEMGDTCFFEIIPSMKDAMDVRIERWDTSEE